MDPDGQRRSDLDLTDWSEDAGVAARLRESYASLSPSSEEQIAHCMAHVMSSAARDTREAVRAWPSPWWLAVAMAAVVTMAVSLRTWAPAASPRSARQMSAVPAPATTGVAATTPPGDATRFNVKLSGEAKAVALVGDFNGWDETATPMARHQTDGTWSANVPLAPGRHVYAFIVNGKVWLVDPLAPQVPDAGYGPANAVVVEGLQ